MLGRRIEYRSFEKGFKNNSTYTECPQSSHLFP